MKVLVTGGAGFLGSHVCMRMLKDGNEVICLDNFYTGQEYNVQEMRKNPKFEVVKHDITEPLPDSCKQVDQIYHLACAASPVHYQAEPIHTTLTCVVGTNNLLMLAKERNIPILITSTSEVYGDPDVHPQPEDYKGSVNCTGPRACYDEGKRCAESLCFDYNRKYGVKVRVARIFNTYGPNMCFNDGRIISNFVVQALSGKNITIYGTGEYTRSFQYCDDLVEGFVRLCNSDEVGPVNLGNPEEYSVADMATMIRDMCDSKSEIVKQAAVIDDPKQRKPDISKAKKVLDWEPKVNVKDGLQATIDWFRDAMKARGQL